jgi:general secretion pathway protein K
MRRSRIRPPRRQQGYVLVTVLVAIVLLALVAVRLDERIDGFRQASADWGRWVRDQGALASARDELLFGMVTHGLTPFGFGTAPQLLRVDGRVYRMPSGVHVSVQDARGLLSVGAPDREVEPLLDKLADYADADSLRRLNGAEAAEYAAAGLPPPANEWPVSPFELRRVLGWHERPALWQHASDHFTVVRDGWINPNTAPRSVLEALPGATPEGVDRLLALRETLHFADAASLQASTGLRLPDDPVAFYPGQFYRLRLWRPGSPGAVEYTVMLTPGAPELPWLVMEVRQVMMPPPPPSGLPGEPQHAKDPADPHSENGQPDPAREVPVFPWPRGGTLAAPPEPRP